MTKTSATHTSPVLQSQNGMVLLLCLVFLTALTLLGLSASADTILQNQLASNLQETERARQSASAALVWAESWLLERAGPAPETCNERCAGLFLHAAETLPPRPEFESLSWWLEHGHEAGIDPATSERVTTIAAGSFNPPLWIIESAHEIPPGEDGTTDLQVWYRILARGSGHTEAGVSVIESVMTRRWASPGHTASDAPVACPGVAATARCGRVSWRELR